MFRIFELTRKQLDSYVGSGMDDLYKKATGDTKRVWANTKDWGKKIGKAIGWLGKK